MTCTNDTCCRQDCGKEDACDKDTCCKVTGEPCFEDGCEHAAKARVDAVYNQEMNLLVKMACIATVVARHPELANDESSQKLMELSGELVKQVGGTNPTLDYLVRVASILVTHKMQQAGLISLETEPEEETHQVVS